MTYHTGKIQFVPQELPLFTRLRMLFVRSRYGFDQSGEDVIFVRSKEVGNTIYVLERGRFLARDYRTWAIGRDLGPSRRSSRP